MTAQKLNISTNVLEEEIILEKKQSSFNFKNFYLSQNLDYSPYLKKDKDDYYFFTTLSYQLSQYVKNKVVQLVKSDKFSTQKKELNSAFSKLIENRNFQEINDFVKHGFIPTSQNHQLLVKKLDKEGGEGSLFPIQKTQPLFGILAQLLFINSHFQIHCDSILEKLQNKFPGEILSTELFSELYDSGKEYKGHRIKDLNYDKENLLAAVNMHNTCINPEFSLNLFSYALKRVFNDKMYSYCSMQWSVGSVLTTLYPYIEPYLSLEDKKFLIEKLQTQRDKVYKEGTSLEICKVIDQFSLLVGNNNSSVDQATYKQQLIEQVQHIYGNSDQSTTPIIPHILPLTIENNILLSEHTDLIGKIKSIHNKLTGFEQLLDNDTVNQVNKIVSETLPLTIEKYNSIDINFREKVKNIEGKNAHQLFSESLENILLIMQDVELNLEQAKVNDLSLTNRKNRIK